MTEEQILENLNEPQKEAVTQTEGPVLILAGAGSGKTRTIVHRIAYLIHVKNVPARKIVALTFTNKAAQEMRERAFAIAGPESADCIIRTYHSLGLYLLRRLAPYISYPSNFTIWDETDQVGAISTILSGLVEESLNKNEIKYFVQTINSFKDSLIGPASLDEKVDLDQYEMGEFLPEVYHLYEQKKTESRAVDFADLLFMTVQILKSHPDALAQLHSRFTHFLVDEYQDTNHAQYAMMKILSSANKNICVVGDDDQAIYTWRGADIRNILDFTRDYGEAKVVKLEENYRSTQPILDLANILIQNNEKRMEKKLWTQIKGDAKARLFVFATDREESSEIGNMVQTLMLNTEPSEIAVLYRTNSQSRLIEEQLIKRGIGYRVFGGPSFFNRKEIKDVLSYLKILVNPFDEASFFRIINTPNRGIGDKTLQKIMSYKADLMQKDNRVVDFLVLLKSYNEMPVSAKVKANLETLSSWLYDFREKIQRKSDMGLLLEDLLDASGLRDELQEEDRLLGTSRMENIRELKNSLIGYGAANPDAVLADYLQEISLFSNTKDNEARENSVNLMTVHNAKGLEFDSVIVAGLDDDIFPHYLSKERDDSEEERRLLYVAITRAKRRLFFTRAQNRFAQGFPQNTRPSIFLAQMDNQFEVIEKGNAPALPRMAPSYRSAGSASGFKNTISAGAANSLGLKNGDRVRHPSFGVGRVLKLEGSGDSCKIHIFFQDKKSRKFILKYANLQRA